MVGSAYWPITLAGRILCWLLALYAFAVFDYITATIASYFLGGSGDAGGQQSGEISDEAAIQSELAAMRGQLAVLLARFEVEELRME